MSLQRVYTHKTVKTDLCVGIDTRVTECRAELQNVEQGVRMLSRVKDSRAEGQNVEFLESKSLYSRFSPKKINYKEIQLVL